MLEIEPSFTVNEFVRAHTGPCRNSSSHLTPRWRKPDSNSQSHPRERVSFGDEPTQIPKAMSWQTNGRRRLLSQDYDETAEDLEIGASEIRPPELLPEGKRPR